MIEALSKAFLCRLLSVSCKQDASDYEQNTPEYTYQRNETVFFPENWTDFLFQELPEEIQSKIVYIYSVINEYSLRSRDVHSTPSWHKWSDFEYRPWCLAIVVRTPGYGQLVLSGWWWTINYNQACFKFRIRVSNVQVFKGCKLRTCILYGVENFPKKQCNTSAFCVFSRGLKNFEIC